MMNAVASLASSATDARANAKLTVADAVWVAVAMMQREIPDGTFTTENIVNVTQGLHLTEGAFKSIWQHVNQHCVANRPPQPNKSRILFATGEGNRRLFRDGDQYDPERASGRTHPEWNALPSEYADLRHWYEREWNKTPVTTALDPLLALAGKLPGMWDGLDADSYVASLRAGWEGRP